MLLRSRSQGRLLSGAAISNHPHGVASAWGPHFQQVVGEASFCTERRLLMAGQAVSGGGSCVPWAAVASTRPARSARSQRGFESVWCQEEYRWHRGAWYVLHLFRRPVVGLVPAWWGLW